MSSNDKASLLLNELIIDSDTPGLQYILLNADSTIFEFNGGLSDLEKKEVFTYSTTINAFSVTKTFTALAILQLEEKGILNLEDFAQTYIDSLPYKSNFTIRQLLNHTAGIPNPIPLKWIHLLNEHDGFNYKEFVKNVVEDNDEIDNDPGKKFSYSNIGYLLLGEIIEKVAGEDYRNYIKNNIINKLSLSEDDYLDFAIHDSVTHARGYIKKWSFLNFGLNFVFEKSKYIEDTYDGWNQFQYYYLNGYPFGGLIGNARGFSKYLQLLLRDNELITNNSKSKLFENQKTNNGQFTDMSLGWFIGSLNGIDYFTHAGGGGGYYCEIRIYPKLNLASVIMFNRTGVSDERFLDNIDTCFIPTIREQ